MQNHHKLLYIAVLSQNNIQTHHYSTDNDLLLVSYKMIFGTTPGQLSGQLTSKALKKARIRKATIHHKWLKIVIFPTV